GNQQTAQQVPRVTLRDCFVRGAGDLLTIRASRACELEVVDSLVALDGSLLTVDGSGKDVARNHTEVTLRQVTTYLTDHLVWLRANKDESKPNKGLVQTMIKTAANCLFVSARGKSLIHLDGVDTDEQMKYYFSWVDSQHNAFSNFDRLLDQQPG